MHQYCDLRRHACERSGSRLGVIARRSLFGEKFLDIPHRHAAGIDGDDLVVEAGEALLVLGYQYPIEASLTSRRSAALGAAIGARLPHGRRSLAGRQSLNRGSGSEGVHVITYGNGPSMNQCLTLALPLEFAK